jgi:hypothetical protein
VGKLSLSRGSLGASQILVAKGNNDETSTLCTRLSREMLLCRCGTDYACSGRDVVDGKEREKRVGERAKLRETFARLLWKRKAGEALRS